ncbi:MAG: glycosyltransferase [Terriglobales bacterium]
MIAVGQVNKFWGRDRGGVEAVMHAEVLDLSRRGYRVAVLACRPRGTVARGFPPGVAGRELAAPVVASMPVHWGFPRALAELAAECDLLHFHLPFPLAEAAALRLPKRGPWVATLHAEVLGHAGWMRRAQRAVTERFLRRVDTIIVSSAHTSELSTLAPHQARVRVIPFGFDLTPYLQATRRPAGAASGGLPVVVYLGRLVAYKGVDVLLRAAAEVRARFHIIGEGRERPKLERLASELGVGGRVEFLGHLPDAELPGRLRAADIFALPSRTQAETFGVAQVEAMAAGLPVVNTALATGTDWVSAHGVTGLTVTPDDPRALAAALVRLIEDREFRLACGRRAQARARTLFSLERRGPELAALYGELLPQRAAS